LHNLIKLARGIKTQQKYENLKNKIKIQLANAKSIYLQIS